MRRPPVVWQSHLHPLALRDLEFAVEEKKLALHTGVIVARIEPQTAWLQPAEYDPGLPPGGRPVGELYPAPARFVFALLGQHGDPFLFHRLGLCLQPDGRPARDPMTFETNVPGIYVAGSLAGSKLGLIVAGRAQTASVIHRIAERIRKTRDE
jgi:thioredoxin reductase